MKTSWDDYSIYYGNLKFMFQTTNQMLINLGMGLTWFNNDSKTSLRWINTG